MKKGYSGGGMKGSCPAPDFARTKGGPPERISGSRAPNSGQTKMPADQGGRSEGSKKS